MLTYEFKIKQKRLSKMSSIGNISSLCTGKVQSTFFKLTNGILKTEMRTKDKTKRLRRKSGYRHLPFKPTICSICTSSNLSEGGSAKFPVRDDEHVSSFGAKGLEPEEYYQALIFLGGRCGGGSGLVADKKEMNFLTLFQTQCAHWYQHIENKKFWFREKILLNQKLEEQVILCSRLWEGKEEKACFWRHIKIAYV